MEGDDVETGVGGAAVSSSRWNPTKEQINILENMYKQGVRTPSAEQIQQITSRLKDYGHIEGKNVFYWFQNHKARQRQKQKQESLAFFNHFVHTNPLPVFPQFPCPNVVCSPYYIRQNDVGFYPQYPNCKAVQGSNVVRRRSKSERFEKQRNCNGGLLGFDSSDECYVNPSFENDNKKETLSLFPTHPTGDLQVRPPPVSDTASASFDSADFSNLRSSGIEGSYEGQGYFDFFCSRQS